MGAIWGDRGSPRPMPQLEDVTKVARCIGSLRSVRLDMRYEKPPCDMEAFHKLIRLH